MTLRLNGSTSGYTEIDAPAVAGSNTLVLPTGNGTAGNILGTDGSGNLSWVNGRMVLETAKSATGTAIDFTGIPSWVKRVTVMFSGVSTNGASVVQIQLGSSSGVEITGYAATLLVVTGSNLCSLVNFTTGFGTVGTLAANTRSGLITFANINGNSWVASGTTVRTDDNVSGSTQGLKTLGATLDRIRITTVNGTDTFDAGSINILMEG